MTAPAWLVQRGGDLKRGSDGKTWYVLFGQQPNYSLVAVPVESDKFGCVIRQTINGKRIDSQSSAASPDEAVQKGLEDLCKALGWG